MMHHNILEENVVSVLLWWYIIYYNQSMMVPGMVISTAAVRWQCCGKAKVHFVITVAMQNADGLIDV